MGSRGSLFIEFIEKCQKAKLCGALQYAIWDGKPQRGHTHAHADKHTQTTGNWASAAAPFYSLLCTVLYFTLFFTLHGPITLLYLPLTI